MRAHHDSLPRMVLRRSERQFTCMVARFYTARCRGRTSFNMTWFGRWCGESSNSPVEVMRDIRSGLEKIDRWHEFGER